MVVGLKFKQGKYLSDNRVKRPTKYLSNEKIIHEVYILSISQSLSTFIQHP
jgi:hypothetical protein